MNTLNGYSKSKAKADDTLKLIGTATAVTDKHTGEKISMVIQWIPDEE